MERKALIITFAQEEAESLSNAWERFKLLFRKCLNHNMSSIEQMTCFIDGLRTHTIILRDASTRGTLSLQTDEELRILIENMC